MIWITLLGRGELRVGEESVRFPTRRALALCAYLVLEGATLRSRLAALLWPDHEESSARVNLRQELRRLRATPLGAQLHASGDILALSADVMSDAGLFELLSGQGDFAAALPHYGGRLLDGTEFFDAPDLGDWLEAQRERLHTLWTAALAAQAQALEEGGQLTEALALWQRLLRTDELRERWHAETMRLHLRLGEREAALRQFARCQAMLKDELGLTPLPETLALAEQARRAVPAPHLSVPPRPAPPLPPLLVGRADTYEALRQRLGTLIVGEPGIGKSALARAACGQVKVLILSGHEAGRHTPFSPATAALERHFAGLSGEEQAILVPMLPGRHLPPDPALRAGFRRAVAKIMEQRLGRDGVLLLEDLHWFDSASCEVLGGVLERCAEVGTWVLATARPHELSQNPAALRLSAPLTRLNLGPLGQADLAELTRAWTHAAPDPNFLIWLHDATAGNPLAVRETLRRLRDTQGEGPLKVPPESEAAPVRALILQRALRLGVQAQRVLEAASVCSPAFSVRQLARCTALDEWTCLDLLEDAQQAGLLDVEDQQFRFSHDLIRRAILSSLSPVRAALLHRHMAAELERGGAPEQVAQHLEAAGEDASGWWWKAACAAERVYAYPQALAHSERALAGQLTPETRLACHRRRLLWWRTVDDRPGWKTEVERLEALAYREGEAGWWLEARLARLEWLFHGGRYREVLDLGQQVVADPNATPEQHARALLEYANAQVYLGQYHEAQRHLHGALDVPGVTLAELPELYGRLHHSLTASALETGDLKMAAEHAELARRGFERAGSRMGQLRSLFNSFAIADRSGELEAAREAGLLALNLAREMEDRQSERLALFNLTSLAIKAESVELAQSLMVEVELMTEGEADPRTVQWANLNRAEICRLNGDLGGSVAFLQLVLAQAEAVGDTLHQLEATHIIAELLLELRLFQEARRVIGRRELHGDTESPTRQMIEARMLGFEGHPYEEAVALGHILHRNDLDGSRSRDRLVLHLARALINAGHGLDARQLLAEAKLGLTPSVQARRVALGLWLEADQGTVDAARRVLAAGNIPPIERLELLEALSTVHQPYLGQAQELRRSLMASLLPALEVGWPGGRA
ncbi:AAA family ATPase [Deinococcus rubellus]|uniref:AAA family ATPase n=1 Tax=Deinococcus rubellus TaxID=1889240 RepID=A0ABY5YE99_9DEIO|nr:BTAD domain-containing putative transcriptional regulator [Deinococcus rubellus]UWX63266.1 AAA family ATPase [Deinococcus rubellus]